jgi:RNA polymerase subunit RPABC4/transcription elongation factor Spt4
VPDWPLVAETTNDENPFESVTAFFDSATWDFIVLLLYFFVIVVWLSCAYWVFKDARRRIDDKVVLGVAALTGLVFGPLGALVYAIVRPPEYLDDIRERELEIRMMEQRVESEERCPFCRTPTREDYLVCPTCGRRLRTVCVSCRRPIDPQWRVCPYCEAEVHGSAPAYENAHT